MIVTPKCARIIIEDLIYKWLSPSARVALKSREGGSHSAEFTHNTTHSAEFDGIIHVCGRSGKIDKYY